MKVERTVTVELSPDEIKDIIIKHLSRNKSINIEKVQFNTNREYHGFQDEQGTVVFSGANCEGLLSSDED